jgi:hypothetical protein
MKAAYLYKGLLLVNTTNVGAQCRDTYWSTYLVYLKMFDTLLFCLLTGDFKVVL